MTTEESILPKEAPKIRCALYMRVSTEGQLDGASLDAQESALYQYIEGFKNKYSLNKERHVYIDMAQSGRTDDRPEFNKLMEAAERREFDVILVWKLDRFFRNLGKAIEHIEELDGYNVGVKSITQEFDTTTSFGRTIFNIMMAFAELESNLIKDRTILGKTEKAKQGKYVGGGIAPYGYSIDENKVIQVNEDEAKVVRLIYHKFINEKMKVSELAQFLSKERYPIRSIKRVYKKSTKVHMVKLAPEDSPDAEKTQNYSYTWTTSFLYSILKNSMYYGEYYYGKSVVGKGNVPRKKLQEMKAKKKKGEDVYEEDLQPRALLTLPCPHILAETVEESKKISEKARIRLLEGRAVNKRGMNHYIFSGKLYSGLSGYRYTGYRNSKNGNISYRLHRDKNKPNYELKEARGNIGEKEMVGKVMHFIKDMIDCKPEKLADLFSAYKEGSDINKLRKEQLIAIEDKIKMLNEQKLLAYQDRLHKLVEVSVYAEMVGKLNQELDLYYHKEAELKNLIIVSEQNMEAARTLKQVFENFQKRINDLTYEEQCELCEIIVDKVTLYIDDEVYLLNFSNDIYNVLKGGDDATSSGKKTSGKPPSGKGKGGKGGSGTSHQSPESLYGAKIDGGGNPDTDVIQDLSPPVNIKKVSHFGGGFFIALKWDENLSGHEVTRNARRHFESEESRCAAESAESHYLLQ